MTYEAARPDRGAARIGTLEDDANVKAAFLMASKRVLLDLAARQDLNPMIARDIQAVLADALVDTESTKFEDMQKIAVGAIKDILRFHKIERPSIGDTFLELLAEEMKVRFQ